MYQTSHFWARENASGIVLPTTLRLTWKQQKISRPKLRPKGARPKSRPTKSSLWNSITKQPSFENLLLLPENAFKNIILDSVEGEKFMYLTDGHWYHYQLNGGTDRQSYGWSIEGLGKIEVIRKSIEIILVIVSLVCISKLSFFFQGVISFDKP